VKAIVYSTVGEQDVLGLADRPVPAPGPGEVRVGVAISGVNPTDWKCRKFGHVNGKLLYPEVIPHHDGSGVVDAVGPGVAPDRVGQRVWLWGSAWRRPGGTAAEFVVLPEHQAVALPPDVSLELGASIGIPALAAHACLTAARGVPTRLGPGSLTGRTVLVAGGAGVVAHSAIQLATWAGASVIATVSGQQKEQLARASGAGHVLDYRSEQAAEDIRAIAPDGVDLVVEVAAAANLALDMAVLAPAGTVAVYGTEGAEEITLPTRRLMGRNFRYAFVLALTLPAAEKDAAVAGVAAAIEAGALSVGEDVGLPLHRFPLGRTGDAHDAVEGGTIGKVLVDLA
jgi:NADPH2:quinone reductase